MEAFQGQGGTWDFRRVILRCLTVLSYYCCFYLAANIHIVLVSTSIFFAIIRPYSQVKFGQIDYIYLTKVGGDTTQLTENCLLSSCYPEICVR